MQNSGHGLALGLVYDMRCLGKNMYQHINVKKNSLWNVIAIMRWLNILSAEKNSDFRVDLSYLQSFFNDIFSHTSVIDLLERTIVLFDW